MYNKVIAGEARHKNNISMPLLLMGGLITLVSPILQSCASTRVAVRPIVAPVVKNPESYTTEPRYISQEVYQQLLYSGMFISGLGEYLTIMDIQGAVENIRSLCGIRATSFATTQMPRDMERILRKYKTDDEYGDYYNYVLAITQRVVLCPNISRIDAPTNSIIYGFTMQGVDLIYPTENTIYVNTLHNMRDRDSVIRLISDVIHETSHMLLMRLFESGKLPEFYLSKEYSERYAYIRQNNFLKAIMQDTETYYDRTNLSWHINKREEEIIRYNLLLGLSRDDRTLFPR